MKLNKCLIAIKSFLFLYAIIEVINGVDKN